MKESAGKRILMLLENNAYQEDVRVRREAEALSRAGFRLSVISPNVGAGFRISNLEGIDLYQYPAAPGGSGLLGYTFEFGWAMLATLALSVVVALKGGFDVIHAHNPPDTLVFVAAVYKPFGKRFVFDHHDLSPEMYGAKFGAQRSPVVERFLLALERLTFWASDHVIATNESYREVALTRGRMNEDRVTVVRNAPDLNRVRRVGSDPDLRRRAPIIIGYVGEMSQQDGVDYLLRALAHLVHDLGRTDFLCVIVGRGGELANLKSESQSLGLDDYVWFTGRVTDDELMRYLSTADICVDPDPSNPFNDRSTMIKMTEYMALGKPIVAFDLPEHRVTADGAALYARANDELDYAHRLAELMDDPGARSTLGELGRRRIQEELAWPHQEKRLLDAYARLLNGTAPAQRI